MKLHRFFVGNSVQLDNKLWLHDSRLLHQWLRVLRFNVGREVVLFNGQGLDKLYRINKLTADEAGLESITQLTPKTPKRDVYLLWSLIKKDKNDWVLQKCTELGVSHFLPITSERTEKTGFDVERAERIVIEAAEQCGRSDIPHVRAPLQLHTAITELKPKLQLLVAEQSSDQAQSHPQQPELTTEDKPSVGVFIGPEGGWTEAELEFFDHEGLERLNLHNFTLRAETAAVAAVHLLLY